MCRRAFPKRSAWEESTVRARGLGRRRVSRAYITRTDGDPPASSRCRATRVRAGVVAATIDDPESKDTVVSGGSRAGWSRSAQDRDPLRPGGGTRVERQDMDAEGIGRSRPVPVLGESGGDSSVSTNAGRATMEAVRARGSRRGGHPGGGDRQGARREIGKRRRSEGTDAVEQIRRGRTSKRRVREWCTKQPAASRGSASPEEVDADRGHGSGSCILTSTSAWSRGSPDAKGETSARVRQIAKAASGVDPREASRGTIAGP